MKAAATRSESAAGPFGRIAQLELEYMLLAGTPCLERHLYTVLRVRYDPRRRAVVDRIDTLAKWSGLGYRTVQRGLKNLEKAGIVQRHFHGIVGGLRGMATVVWTTVIVPYERWPTEPLERVIAATLIPLEAYRWVFLRHGDAAPASPSAPRSVTDRPGGGEGQAWRGRRTRLATRNNPESYPDPYPERDAPLERRGNDEDRDSVNLRVLRWQAVRDAGARSFADDVAGRWLATEIRRALTAGIPLTDLDRAIDLHIEARHADPRELHKWIAEVTEARGRQQLQCEWKADQDRIEERLVRERAESGHSERMALAIAQGRARLRATSAAR